MTAMATETRKLNVFEKAAYVWNMRVIKPTNKNHIPKNGVREPRHEERLNSLVEILIHTPSRDNLYQLLNFGVDLGDEKALIEADRSIGTFPKTHFWMEHNDPHRRLLYLQTLSEGYLNSAEFYKRRYNHNLGLKDEAKNLKDIDPRGSADKALELYRKHQETETEILQLKEQFPALIK
ncbi:hypothetical protein HZA76_00120 [Candidatus Roizmanbacteria bacterium]|nr:hypothetical protein [Candidatus Roizmanbacteria bacterium]